MLVIRRRKGEKILIGEGVEIEVIECGRNRVKLGIHAPKCVPILRDELRATREQNLAAALALAPGVLSGALKNIKAAAGRSDQEIDSSQKLAAPPSLPA
jgi:carbon storage regulator